MDKAVPIPTLADVSGARIESEHAAACVLPQAALTTIRAALGFASDAERQRVLEWLNAGLRPQRPGRLQLELPFLFEKASTAIPIIRYERDEPRAFCMLWPRSFSLRHHAFRVGLVSLVYTDPLARGHGHASQIVRQALDEAARQNLGCVLLWSDLPKLYSPLGFDRSGCETLLILDRDALSRAIDETAPSDESTESWQIESPDELDWPAIGRLRQDRACVMSLENGLERLRHVPDMSVRIVRDSQGVRAFAMRGRGDDFAEVIHEWGGDPHAALLCCRALLEASEPEHELFVLSPVERSELTWALRSAGARVIRQPLAWARIASSEALTQDLIRLIPDAQGLSIEEDRDASDGSPRLRLRSPRGSIEIEQSVFFDALFGTQHASAQTRAAARLAAVLPESALSSLPLPLFVWGLESI